MSVVPGPTRAAPAIGLAASALAAALLLVSPPALAAPPHDAADADAVEADPEVLLFVTSWCPVCREATAWMKAEGIPHLALDVESDPRAMELYQRAGGDGAVPLILVGAERIRGFDPRSVQRALDRSRAASTPPGSPVAPTPPTDDSSPGEASAGVTETVGADGKVHYRVDDVDIGGDVHGPQVEFVTTRPDVDEVTADGADPLESGPKLPLPDPDEDE